MKLTIEKARELMAENDGDLDLEGTDITELPDNLTVDGWLDLRDTGITSLPDNLTVGGWLDLSHTGITSLPDNLTVGGWLDLRDTGITSLPDNLTVGGWLDLRDTGITSLPDNLTVGGWLNLRGTGITSLPENLTVGGGLDLCGTGITSLPENLTVGGSLDLNRTGITSLPENLTVGGGLYLNRTGITSLPENLTVGGSLDLCGTGITLPAYKRLKDGDYVPGRYLYADGILTHVRRRRTVGQYTWYAGKINTRNVVYDGTYYAHCRNLREGVADLLYKHAEDRGAEQYRGLTMDSVLPEDEAIAMYRVITGACQAGTRQFVENLKNPQKSYTVREMIALTRGQYNAERFAEFFGE